VGRVSRREVAIQAGVSPEQVTAFVDLGILKPADDGSFSAAMSAGLESWKDSSGPACPLRP
jgi:hypothetical protein